VLLGAVELPAARRVVLQAARRVALQAAWLVALQAAWLVVLLALQGPLQPHHRFSGPAPAHHGRC
jgi:hypothetical protein